MLAENVQAAVVKESLTTVLSGAGAAKTGDQDSPDTPFPTDFSVFI
jgi:hypothetical protein